MWMDEDLKMLSDPCNGVTCNKESYASKLILQGMTKKVNSWHLSVPMKDKIAYQERCNARRTMFETKGRIDLFWALERVERYLITISSFTHSFHC